MPNNLGKKFIVEECQKVTITEYLDKFRRKFKEEVLGSVLEIAKQEVSLSTTKTGFGGIRYWFDCPSCSRRVGTLLVHPLNQKIGCRICLGLDYRSRRYKGMIEGKQRCYNE